MTIISVIMLLILPCFYVQELVAAKTLQQTLSDTFAAILTGERAPKYIAQYPDTPENRAVLVSEICQLYSSFLLIELHNEWAYDVLQRQGLWIQKRHSYDPLPTSEQILLFSNALKSSIDQIIVKADDKKIWVHLDYDYSPNSDPLESAFKAAGLDDNFYYLLPYKSHTHIHIEDGIISLNLNLAGPPF